MGKWEHDDPDSLYTKFQGTSAEYPRTFKALQPAYENEMDAWKYNEDRASYTRWQVTETVK